MAETDQEQEEETTAQEARPQERGQTDREREQNEDQGGRRFKKGMLKGITFEDVAEHYPMLYFAK
eukprot:12357324-Karenia_brevis.AAC.1